jgi:hypothetical protein
MSYGVASGCRYGNNPLAGRNACPTIKSGLSLAHRATERQNASPPDNSDIFMRGLEKGLVYSLLVFAGCDRHKSTSQSEPPKPPGSMATARNSTKHTAVPPVKACDFLTNADVEKVQGEPLQKVVPGGVPAAGMAVSQCYFATATASKSITLTIWQQVNAKGRDPRDFWRKRFHGEGEKKGGSEEEEKLRKTLN